MRTFPLLGTLIILFSVSCKLQTPNKQISKPHSENKLDTRLSKLIDDQVLDLNHKTELAVALTSNDSIFYYGSKHNKGKCAVVDNSLSLFEIGSISKVFTSQLLVIASEEQLIEIDQSINDFFDFEFREYKDISLEELSSHSSGLPTMPAYFFDPLIDSINPYKDYTSDVLLRDLKEELSPIKATSGDWEYSNFGVSVLGHILGSVYEAPYKSVLQEKILDPIGMEYTTTERDKIRSILVPGLNENGAITSNWDLAAITPAGGIISNVRDLAYYSIHSYAKENTVFPIQSQKILSQPRKNTDQALGWMIYNKASGEPYCYLHAGQTGGYTAIMMIQPASKKSVTILSNYHDVNNTILLLGFKLMKELLNGNY